MKEKTNMEVFEFRLPKWEEFPCVDLYMDQLVSFINEYLGAFFSQIGVPPLTKNMVNNYVKAKIVAAPVNKKYPRFSVAMIISVYILKSCYSTEDIGKLIKLGISLDDPETTYNRFCHAMEDAVEAVFGGYVQIKEEHIPDCSNKHLMENFALSVACKFYVQKRFLNLQL